VPARSTSSRSATISLLGHLPEDSLSPEAERELLEAFQGWKRG